MREVLFNEDLTAVILGCLTTQRRNTYNNETERSKKKLGKFTIITGFFLKSVLETGLRGLKIRKPPTDHEAVEWGSRPGCLGQG